MEITLLLFIFVLLELFETTWQKSNTLHELLQNNFFIFKKNIFLYFIFHPSFFYTIFLSFYFNNFGFLMSSILILKFFDISFKLTLMKNLLNGKDINELLQINVTITPFFRYLNVIIYPLTFLFATTL
ncbi:putative membrane protein [Arcobacter ellisii]|jgi:hypothetical protein|uniref:Membrane protein n=2 Tax=Arcobacteraceae TaxID=2808963 RepID=A0A347UB45_9BACT|nr:putative membrane protein [Arcobacter ellisii]MBD3830149.1 hypothetical protein [Arcobacter sp.]RXI28938.1 hypothetical protein CP962_12715 [Arcobacter ellisii]